MINHVVEFKDASLFTRYAGVNIEHAAYSLLAWLGSIFLYIIFIPLQEILVRGFLQVPLQILLIGQYKIAWSIFSSNLIFATSHLFFSPFLALMTFFPVLIWGWLMYKYKTLIAPITSHIISGVFAVSFVGFT